MNNPFQKSTKQNLKDQELEKYQEAKNFIKSPILGTLIVILSGVIIYTDKIIVFFNWNFEMPSRYEQYDFETFIWSISVTISPLLLILAAHMQSRKEAYAIPLYCYTLQLWFILFDLNVVDKGYLGWYALATCSFIIPIVIYFKRKERASIQKRISTNKEKLLSEE